MDIENELSYLDTKISALQKQRKIISDNAEFLKSLGEVRIFESCGMLHFADTNRESAMKIFKHFPGRWNKSYREDKVDYTHEDYVLQIYGGDAPETCRIVEEEVVVPEHKEIRKRLVCVPAEEESVAA